MTSPPKPKSALNRRLIVAAGVAGAIAWALLNRDRLDIDIVERWLDARGALAPLLFMGLYALATVLFLPGSALTLAGGALFGVAAGALYSLIGATVGASLAFLLARYLFADAVARRAGGVLQRLLAGVEREGWRFVAFVRLVPLFPFSLVNYAFGLARLRLLTYAGTSFVCMAPGALAYAWIGHAGRQAATGGEGTVRNILIAVSLLAAVMLLPSLVRRMRRAPPEAGDAEKEAELRGSPHPGSSRKG